MPRHDAGQECKCQEAFEPWTDAVKINAKCSLNLVFEHPQRCKWQQSKKNILKHPILQYFAGTQLFSMSSPNKNGVPRLSSLHHGTPGRITSQHLHLTGHVSKNVNPGKPWKTRLFMALSYGISCIFLCFFLVFGSVLPTNAHLWE